MSVGAGKAEVRIEAGVSAFDGKVELLVGDEWQDISRIVTRAEIIVDPREPTSLRLTLVPAEIATRGVADERTLRALAEIVDLAREKGHIE